MADFGRASTFLPTIKCSMCAADIEISKMGDHVCAGRASTPPTDSYGSSENIPFRKDPAFLKPGRALPPRVDTFAANRPFFSQDQLTPASSSPSRSTSPFSPNDGSRSPFKRPLRSATAPTFRGPPSPETLSSNLDCAFPPFPTAKLVQSKPQFAALGGERFAEPDPNHALVSPRNVASGGLLQRMNTIAPGPFDVNGRRLGRNTAEDKGYQRQATHKGSNNMKTSTGTAEVGDHIQRPATADLGHSRTSTNSSNGSRSGFGLPKQPKKDGYGGFGKPPAAVYEDSKQEISRSGQLERSQTFPLPRLSLEPIHRRPSEPRAGMPRPSNESERPIGSGRSVSGSPPRQRNQPTSGPDLTRPLPPRGASLIRPRVGMTAGDAPALPANINLDAEFGIGNPYHTPSESQSSNDSGYSQESMVSSRSSNPSATASRQRRQPSDTSKFEGLTSKVQASMTDSTPKESSSGSSPEEKQFPGAILPLSVDRSLLSPESPMDPAIQSGRLSPVPVRNPARTQESVSPPKEKPIRRPTTSKGNCKGCGEAIKGKSVSSADGRLTGRYHKQCFVCKTCSEPFQTATFYVIKDEPYCERHYHKLNGSVCATCNKGIEGQYLESERKQKFHPNCLTCSDCKQTLRHDYFERDGRVYCEFDAFRRAQQKRFLGPGVKGSERMERRTTRLMMM